jgi:hypothetical protein
MRNALPVTGAMGELAAAPQLNASLAGGVLTLTWSLSGAAASLTMTTNLGPSAIWLPVTNSVQRTGTVFSVSLPVLPGPPYFYHLRE